MHNPPTYHELSGEPGSSITRTVTQEPPSYENDPALPTTFKIGKSYTPPVISPSLVRKHLFVLGAFQTLRRRVEAASYANSGLYPEPSPEVKWAIYLLRASHRLELWLDKVVKNPQRERGEIGELTDGEIPPIDVLVLLHAYFLNPVNYYEDTENTHKLLKTIAGFPLDRVGGSQMKRLDGNEVEYTPNVDQVEEWELATQQPYVLPLVTTLDDTVGLTCPMCGNQDLSAPWITKPAFSEAGGAVSGQGYAQNGFRVSCGTCQGVVTKQALQAGRFARDFVRVRNEIRRGNDAWFLNSLINVHTGKPAPVSAAAFAKLTVDTIQDLDETSTYPPHIALGHYFGWDLAEAQRLIEAGFRRRGGTRAWMGDSISRMMRGFRQRGSMSLDVVGAAMRQFKFAAQVEELGWTDKLYFGTHPEFIKNTITQYHLFLDLFAHNPSRPLVPTLLVDLGWHTHMLNAEGYRDDCMRFFGRYMNHDDKVEEGKLATAFDDTSRLWKSRFNESYSVCGCLSFQATRSPSSKLKFWKKTSEPSKTGDSLDHIATHPTEHNSMSAVNPKRAVVEAQRARAASFSKSSTSLDHPRAFFTDYQKVDARQFPDLGMAGWDLDCLRKPFVVDGNQNRGDCCIGVHISCSTISHMSATGEGSIGSKTAATVPGDYAIGHRNEQLRRRSFPLFLLIGLGIFFWATNLHVLHLLGIDTVWVLDLRRDKLPASSPPTPLPTARSTDIPYDVSSLEAISLYKSVYKLFLAYGMWIGWGWVCFRWITGGVEKSMDAYKLLPAFTAAGIVFGLVCPFNVLMKRERFRFLHSLWRCLTSPSKDPVYFSDVILADVFTSFAKVIADLWISACMILPSGTLLRAKTEGAISESVVPLMMALPYAIRFRQCMMEYIGSKRTSGRALANAIKYATAFPVIFLSVAQRSSLTGPLDAKPEGETKISGYLDNKVFKIWLLAVIVNSVYSFWWDVTNDWGLTLLKPSTWPAQHAASAPRSPYLRSQSRTRGRSPSPLITLSRSSSATALSVMGSTYSDVDGIMRVQHSHPFGLRDNLLFRDSLVYYLVIFLNLFLRFTWSLKLSTHLDTVEELESSVFLIEALEVTRRWVWVFFRVEWEAIKKEQAASTNGEATARSHRSQAHNDDIEFDLLGPSRALTPDPTVPKSAD
ncbi:ER retention-like protein [Ceratobasidium sp. AG-Ba]|nr:ER retention-like protein [Ceratobasidium sp. AG-Ba]